MSNRVSLRDRPTKALMRQLEYVACKSQLWAKTKALRDQIKASRTLSALDRLRFKHWLFWKYGPECGYCHRVLPMEALTIDHIQPKSKGGAVRDINNMVLACLGCNRDKGNTWPYTTE